MSYSIITQINNKLAPAKLDPNMSAKIAYSFVTIELGMSVNKQAFKQAWKAYSKQELAFLQELQLHSTHIIKIG